MFNNLFEKLYKNLAIDLGTYYTRIYIQNRGLIINEPSVVSINNRTDEILAVGNEALKMYDKSPNFISVVWPIVNGVVSDFEVAEKMLKNYIEKIYHNIFLFSPRPKVIVPVPLELTEVEKKSVEDVIYQVGARKVLLVERPVAAAIGARLPVHESLGTCLVEMGAGITEVAVISLSGVVTYKSLKLGGKNLNKAIINYIRDNFNLLLGEQRAEDLKIKIGSAASLEKPKQIKVRGRDLSTGLPREIVVNDAQIREAISPILKMIIENIQETIEMAPPELVADIYERGILLSGGAALLPGLDKLIQKNIPIPVHLADDPSTVAVKGAGMILEDFENLKTVILPSSR